MGQLMLFLTPVKYMTPTLQHQFLKKKVKKTFKELGYNFHSKYFLSTIAG